MGTPGKKSTAKALLSNPAVRKIIVRNARKVIGSATTAAANRAAAKSGGSPSKPGTPGKGRSGKPDAITGFAASVAKPMAEKMAAHPTGRSVLEAINNITGDVLGPAKKPQNSPININNLVTKLAGAAAAASSAARTAQSSQSASPTGKPNPQAARVNFTPISTTSAPPPAEPAQSIKWPPPKSATASGTDTAPE